MHYSYANEKFYCALRTLVGSKKNIRDRLIDAIRSNLSPIPSDKNLPEDLRDEFNKLKKEVADFDQFKEEGTIEATINIKDEDFACKCALEILDIYHRLQKYLK